MTKEELIKNQFPNDEFLQSGVSQIVDKCIAELEKENAELKTRVENQKSFLERIRAKFELGEIDRKEIEGYLESENLTKAKELLKTFMKISEENGRQFDEEVYFEAREFLKE